MIKLQIIGNIGQDAKISQYNGENIANFSVAHTYKDRAGTQKTVWVDCAVWRKPGQDTLFQYLTKGKKVFIEGTPAAKPWVDQQGNAHASLTVNVITLELLSDAAGSQQQPAAAAPAPAAPAAPQQPAAPAPQPQQYQVGQVVNGYQLQASGQWIPVQQAAPPAQPQQPAAPPAAPAQQYPAAPGAPAPFAAALDQARDIPF